MAGPLVLGLDQGLSGARAVVMTADGRALGRGRVGCTDIVRTPNGPEHRPGAWLDEVFEAARRALEAADVTDVDAIGIGALGPAPVLVDEALRPVAPAPLFPQDTASVIRRWRGDPSLVERARWCLDLCGFIGAALTGRPMLDRITAADAIEAEGWPGLGRLEPCEPFAVAGGLTDVAASRLGLAAGTPVTAGTYDTFVDLAALGVERAGDRGILLGSTLIVGEVRDDDRAPGGLRSSPHVGQGSFVGGWTQAAGRALTWWLDLFDDERRREVATAAAGLPPGAGGLIASPYLDGERAPVWDPDARGALVGLSVSTTAPECYRALVDAVALSAADLADRLATSAGPPWMIGGGGVNDEAWLHATVDAIGEPALVADLTDATGAAISAFCALELPRPDLPTRVVEPHAGRHATYAAMLAPYRELYPALAPIVRSMSRPIAGALP